VQGAVKWLVLQLIEVADYWKRRWTRWWVFGPSEEQQFQSDDKNDEVKDVDKVVFHL